jgi:hypothetical protein
VASVCLGCPVRSVEINNEGLGLCRNLVPKSLDPRERVRRQFIVSLAAPIACEIEFGAAEECGGDRENQRRLLAQIDPEEAGEFRGECEQAARALVARNRRTIRLVAERLFEAGQLDGEVITTS